MNEKTRPNGGLWLPIVERVGDIELDDWAKASQQALKRDAK